MTNTTNTTARPTILTAGVHFEDETRIIRRSILHPETLQNIPTWEGEYDQARRTEDDADYIVTPSWSDGQEYVFNLEAGEAVEFSTRGDEMGLRWAVTSHDRVSTLTGTISGYARVTIAR